MRRWAEFEEAAPELAALGRERIEQFGFVFIGTIRRDGGPRVNPVEAHIIEGHLVHCMVWRSLKALDLLRDPRAFLHTPVLDSAKGTPGEFKLRARAVEIRDRALRDSIADKLGWGHPEHWHYFTADIESAAFLRYDEDAGVQRMIRWTPNRGVESSTRTYV
jgi:hypothetical protein